MPNISRTGTLPPICTHAARAIENQPLGRRLQQFSNSARQAQFCVHRRLRGMGTPANPQKPPRYPQKSPQNPLERPPPEQPPPQPLSMVPWRGAAFRAPRMGWLSRLRLLRMGAEFPRWNTKTGALGCSKDRCCSAKGACLEWHEMHELVQFLDEHRLQLHVYRS